MNDLQRHNASKLREMAYRFNSVEANGKDVVLQNRVTLLTGRTLCVTVATLSANGHVEMGDVQG